MEDKKYILKETVEQTPEWYREQGKILFFNKDSSQEQKKYGLKLLVKAQVMGDAEAIYLIGLFLVKGIIGTSDECSVERGLTLLVKAADMGWAQARCYLDSYCDERYWNSRGEAKKFIGYKGPLKDFDGKLIKINRKGILTPIDVELKYENQKNILIISTNLQFVYAENPINGQLYEKAVIDGIMQWQGEYQIFGGQQLEVRVHLTTEERLFDNVVVVQLGREFSNAISAANEIIGRKDKKVQMREALKEHRSFATSGLKWTSTSRKIIYMQSPQGKFDDYNELKSVAKHEFGHALGLGDLYYSPADALEGVEKGSYEEIDSYYISNKIYNLVMCDHHGPISNNDIEMVVLAFRENKMQHYQVSKIGKKVSDALGRGN